MTAPAPAKRTITIFVPGVPVPQGSMRAFLPKGSRRPVTTHSNAKSLKPWRLDVAEQAREAWGECAPSDSGIKVRMVFLFQKPPSTPKRVTLKTTSPDVDKLARGVLDALTGICFRNDAQVVQIIAVKGFAVDGVTFPGMHLEVSEA